LALSFLNISLISYVQIITIARLMRFKKDDAGTLLINNARTVIVCWHYNSVINNAPFFQYTLFPSVYLNSITSQEALYESSRRIKGC